jgi:geranylgeranyl reductase family protein
MEEFDVIICGAGPAGTTCALALANSNLRVAVIEKSNFPRNKVCGDAVAAYVPKVLKTIHPKYAEALESFNEKTIVNTCRIIAPNEKYIDVTSKEYGFISSRMDWDQFLYSLASKEPNIVFFLNHELTAIKTDDAAGEVFVTANNHSFKSKIFIGCDGAHSVSSKILTAQPTDLQHYSGAVRAYYHNVSGFAQGTYELHFIHDILPGYFWIFPLPNNRANVGICVPSSTISAKKINLRKTMEHIIQNHPAIKKRFLHAELEGKIEGYGLPLGSAKRIVSGAHFMLCGDAASLIDPATGEGIGQSMISGRYAAWQAIKCFEANNFSAAFMKQYDKQLYKKLWREARMSYRIQNIVFKNKSLFNACFNFLDRNKYLKRLILNQVVKI